MSNLVETAAWIRAVWFQGQVTCGWLFWKTIIEETCKKMTSTSVGWLSRHLGEFHPWPMRWKGRTDSCRLSSASPTPRIYINSVKTDLRKLLGQKWAREDFKREREEDWLVNGKGYFRPFSEFWDKISLCCSPGYPQTCCLDERALYLSQSSCFCLPSADVTDLCHHAVDEQSFSHSFSWGLKYVNIWPLFTF